MGGDWLALEAGLTGDIGPNRSIYANVGHQVGFDDDRRFWDDNPGLRANG